MIMLTARGSEADQVAGLELGADDYVVKPSRLREVTARCERSCGGPEEARARRDDRDREAAARPGPPLGDPRREGDRAFPQGVQAAADLMERAGTVITRQALLEEVWDMNWFGSTKTLDVHMSGLRKKLGDDASDPQYIHTVRGVGFRFSRPTKHEPSDAAARRSPTRCWS